MEERVWHRRVRGGGEIVGVERLVGSSVEDLVVGEAHWGRDVGF